VLVESEVDASEHGTGNDAREAKEGL